MECKILGSILAVIMLAGCEHPKYQRIAIDFDKGKVKILSHSEFVFDSVFVTRHNKLIFSKSLVDKRKGRTDLSFKHEDFGYKTFINRLSDYNCSENELVLQMILRRKRAEYKLTQDIAEDFVHIDGIQVVTGVRYVVCDGGRDTVMVNRPR
jgi:hypothetical protein